MSRFSRVEFDNETLFKISMVRAAFEVLEEHIEREIPSGREKALILTKLEEAYMWAGNACKKAIEDKQLNMDEWLKK
jgi:hypothetical protein